MREQTHVGGRDWLVAALASGAAWDRMGPHGGPGWTLGGLGGQGSTNPRCRACEALGRRCDRAAEATRANLTLAGRDVTAEPR
jgi:hypothetical protein